MNSESPSIINLEHKKYTCLPEMVLHSTSVQKISLAYNQLKVLDEQIGNLKVLRCLDLSYNQLKKLPARFGELQQLEELNLSYNKFSVFPKIITQLPNLRRLYLQGNILKELPESIANLSKLEIFDISINQLYTLPTTFGKLASLRELQAVLNRLTTLPVSVCKLKNLKKLRLKSNQIKSLPALLGDLQALRTVDLSFNPLQELPPSFGRLEALEALDLTANAFAKFPMVLLELPQLLTLGSLDLNYRLGMQPLPLKILAQSLQKLARRKITAATKQALFGLLFDKKEAIKAPTDTYPLLTVANTLLQKKLRTYLLTEDARFSKKSQLLRLGQTNLLTPEILQCFPQTEDYSKASHFVLGKKIPQKAIKVLPIDAVFVSELQVQNHYQPLKTPAWLVENKAQLIELLRSHQAESILLALQWMSGSTLLKTLSTELLLAYLYLSSEEKEAYEAIRNAFQLSLPQFEHAHLPRVNYKLHSPNRSERELAKRIRDCVAPSDYWEGQVVAEYLFQEQGAGYIYLIENLGIKELQDWLKQFLIQDTLCFSPLKELQELPPLQGNWGKVWRLDLRGCTFIQAPTLEILQQMPNLEEIDLRDNPIRYLPRRQLSALSAYRIFISK